LSEIEALMKELNVPPEKLVDFAAKVRTNPLSAMGAFMQLGLSMDFLSKLATIVKKDPSALSDFAKGLGMDEGAVEEAQKKAEQFFKFK
jgi:hypothetical protein